jgi:hypothetical protein
MDGFVPSKKKAKSFFGSTKIGNKAEKNEIDFFPSKTFLPFYESNKSNK